MAAIETTSNTSDILFIKIVQLLGMWGTSSRIIRIRVMI
jgi:hypothetical protein